MADSTKSLHPSLKITQEEAQAIVRKLLPGHDRTTVSKITHIRSKGYSFTASMKTYILDLIQQTDLGSTTSACFLTIAPPTPPSGEYKPNTLPAILKVLNEARTKAGVPLADPILDTSLTLIPYHLILSGTTKTASDGFLSITDARRLGLFSDKASVLIDIELGKLLGQVHTNVQNDWFGALSAETPSDPSYAWQETFTSLLEGLLLPFERGDVNIDFEIPYQKIRLYHSRAIGFSLFDDVEVPSLIWVTGSEDDIFITKPSDKDDPWSFEIAAIHPGAAHALWGDPLLESFFIPPKPSKAMAEGYIASGGGALTIFPRQNTKRIWYDLFLALLVLYEAQSCGDEDEFVREKRGWCKKVILDSVDALKDAPCY